MNIKKSDLLVDISEPENFYCNVWAYTVHHSELVVRIISDNDEIPSTKKFYFVFSGVIYYEGPIKWKNVELFLDNSELEVILNKLYPKLNNTEKIGMYDYLKLFKFIDKETNLEVKILASRVNRLENLN
jgi:hypothetical protein